MKLLIYFSFALVLSLSACSAGSVVPVDPIEPPVSSTLQGSFESKFIRYEKGQKHIGQTFEAQISKVWKDTVWQNDRVHRQIILWTKNENYDKLTYEVSDLINGTHRIDAAKVRMRFPTYVFGDARALVCGEQLARTEKLIADALVTKPVTTLTTADPIKIWLTADIPSDTPAGLYTGTFAVYSNGVIQQRFVLEFQVVNHRLPSPDEWDFHLDLWQFPFQLAYLCTNNGQKITPFSADYFTLVKPFYQLLADAGQVAISTYIKDGAFNRGQTMVKWTHKTDTGWEFDYTNFDKFVEMMMSCGITKQINCFSLVGWDTSIGYYDEVSSANKRLEVAIGSDEYKAVWNTFLTSFRVHLQQKGWFDKAVLYMDEIKEEEMQAVVSMIKQHDPSWKIGLAGSYNNADVENSLYDYSTLLGYERKSNNRIATFYTSCSQKTPNNYVTPQNTPAEMTWMAWYAAAKGFDGYLRWAYDYWTQGDPMNIQDGSNTAGDFNMIYRQSNSFPNAPVSSIRMELLREGIQDYEKIRLLGKSQFNTVMQKILLSPGGGDIAKVITESESLLKKVSVN